MKTLSLEVFINGSHVGTVDEVDYRKIRFTYDSEYRGPSISVQMPISERHTFVGQGITNWFAGLLPDDRNQKNSMAEELRCRPRDLTLLEKIGADVPGAIQILKQGMSPAPMPEVPYRSISEEEIEDRLLSLQNDEPRAWIEPGEKWSLGGTQTKIALAYLGETWYAANGAAASTHIIKPGIDKLLDQAVIECVTMKLGEKCGIPTASSYIHLFGETPAIIVERYDRALRPDGVVMRFHQEDFCQAAGVAPERKYAKDGGPTTSTFISILKKNCPENDLITFCDFLLFNALTGSTDGHAKNYSLLHFSDEVRLAPQYDVATVLPYMFEGKVYRTALSFGDEKRIGWLRGTCFDKMGQLTGIDADLLRDHAYKIGEKILDNLNPIIDDLRPVAREQELLDNLHDRMSLLVEGTLNNLNRSGREMKEVQITSKVSRHDSWGYTDRA